MKTRTLRWAVTAVLVGLGPACTEPPREESTFDLDAPRRVAANDPATLPYYADESFTPHWAESPDALDDDFHRVPPFSLLNQQGEPISEQTFAGKVYVANFFFTSCAGICAAMNANMHRVQEAFSGDEDVMLLSHSVTPEVDTPEVLLRYAERMDCEAGTWHLATGGHDEIYALGRQGYFVEEDRGRRRDTEAFLHSENLLLVDADRHIRGIYNGLERVDVDRLIRDIATLRGENEAER